MNIYIYIYIYIYIELYNIKYNDIITNLLQKANRIFRIFDTAKKSAQKPKFISNRFTISITFVLIILQVILYINYIYIYIYILLIFVIYK